MYLLKSKDEAIEKFGLYKNEVENQLNKKIKMLISDRGGKYESPFIDFCAQHEIIYETTTPYSPQFNCDAPTRHRVSSEGSYFFFFFKLITFTLAYSNNVKHLTCIILCSSGLQNIYTSSINGCVQHLQYLHLFTKFHIQNRPKGLLVSTYGCVAFDC